MGFVINAGSQSDRLSIQLATKKGTYIKNERRGQRPLDIMNAARDLFLKEHGSLKLRSLCSEYNCMRMAFASRRTCVDTDQLRLIRDEDGYATVQENNCPATCSYTGKARNLRT